MTEQRARALMGIVRLALQPLLYVNRRRHPRADDMLAAGYVSAWQQVERMAPDCPWSWTTIATKAAKWAALDCLRHRRRNAPEIVPLVDLGDDEEPAGDGGLGAAEARLLLRAAERRSGGLTAKQQRVLRLLYWEGLSLSEAGRRLGVSYKTVEGHRQAALAKYRQALE